MAEALVLGPGIIAFVQLADRVIDICKHYIEAVQRAPHDLRIILVEISSLKAILQNLQFLEDVDRSDGIVTPTPKLEGTLNACRESVAELERLFPVDGSSLVVRHLNDADPSGPKRKRPRISHTLAALTWPFKADKAKRLLSEISRQKETITLSLLTESSRDIKELKGIINDVYATLTDGRFRSVCEWLVVTDPSDIHLRACSIHEKDTGQWMLETKAWKDWITNNSSDSNKGKPCRFVWIHGIPGAGKTLLVSFLVSQIPKRLTVPQIGLVYYYCYFGRDCDETGPFLRWVINQLCRQSKFLPTGLVKWYEQVKGEFSRDVYMTALQELLNHGGFERVYIFIDAVDESKEPRTQLVHLLRVLATDSRFAKVQLLASSRDYLDIRTVFSPISVPVAMQVDTVEADIRKYVYTRMEEDYKCAKWPESLRREIQDRLAVGAKGMCELPVSN